jgi:hypothetical protein
MDLSVTSTWRVYFSSDFDVFFNDFFRKIPNRKMHWGLATDQLWGNLSPYFKN